MSTQTQQVEIETINFHKSPRKPPRVIDLTFEDKIDEENELYRIASEEYGEEYQDEELDASEEEEPAKDPLSKAKKCLTVLIFMVGFSLTIAGIVSMFNKEDSYQKSLLFLISGIFLTIPGCYCGYLLVKEKNKIPVEDEENPDLNTTETLD